ncbi:hypothetical protein TNCT_233371 [Trichonephila clavata]|uniref:Uncharacterized protein n=1 Tax=Trichonephila clavata TaxID=2740835 RepID=A0A8X6LR40_TRICU|nr:hypothetical protein TNCT_233371 [Trichonephila clavata]
MDFGKNKLLIVKQPFRKDALGNGSCHHSLFCPSHPPKRLFPSGKRRFFLKAKCKLQWMGLVVSPHLRKKVYKKEMLSVGF